MAEENTPFRQMWKASMVGIHLVVATFVGFLIGHWLDKVFDTRPWLTLIFLFLGIFAGFRDMIKTARRSLSEDDEGV